MNDDQNNATLSPPLSVRARAALNQLRSELLDQRTDDGHWLGELSPSALSTATAVSAMSAVLVHATAESNVDRAELEDAISRGMRYISSQQNPDGGFGDTDRSHSNIATSYLALACSELARKAIGVSLDEAQYEKLHAYIADQDGVAGLRRRYGRDKTFVIPILTNLAIAGVVSWDDVARLPFEAAVFPQSMYRLLRMPVVSYAIPALVAIGQARHFHGRKAWLPIRAIRSAAVAPSMNVLVRMQPESGGYLEATPLTSFVVMSLAATGRGEHRVSRKGVQFLIDSMTDEGSWPIDTNLATWLTSLSVLALSADPEDDGSWCTDSLVSWHLDCQHRERHPFTGAEPGGWGWSDLSGAVPDSDDTPGAILAAGKYSQWASRDQLPRIRESVGQALGWLQRLQNRDGGWPTFCRGWGKLPFDRSSNDLTAHALRAILGESTTKLLETSERGSSVDPRPDHADTAKRYSNSISSGVKFLESNQRPDGSWLPLWFGNQDWDGDENPIYGTSRVLVASAHGILRPEAIDRACRFLLDQQNDDGGWGGGRSLTKWIARDESDSCDTISSSVEETALAVEALVTAAQYRGNFGTKGVVAADHENWGKADGRPISSNDSSGGVNRRSAQAIIRGIEFLIEGVESERHRVAWPIGFYFAKLWYHEKLYPLIFAMMALGKYLDVVADSDAAIGSIRDDSTTSDS